MQEANIPPGLTLMMASLTSQLVPEASLGASSKGLRRNQKGNILEDHKLA